MRIVIAYPGCHRRGGVERVMVESVNHLAGRGHELHALAGEFDRSAISHRVVLHEVQCNTLIPAFSAPKFRTASARCLDAMDPKPNVSAGFGVSTPEGGVAWMMSVHASWLDISQRIRGIAGRVKQRLNPFHPIILSMERRMIEGRRYRKLIALTQKVKEDVMAWYGAPDDDIEILPIGYSPAEFNVISRQNRRQSARLRYGIAEDKKVILFVANELERKGFAQLLRAVARLNDHNLVVLAAGRFSLSKAQAFVRGVGLKNQVIFAGSTSDVAECYAAGDFFALPTQYEAWGLVIVEALACGLPVLTSRLAGAACVINEGRTGLLLDDPLDDVEISSKLSQLLEQRDVMPTEIADSVVAYSWENLLARYESILQKCSN